jgi:hypothetical protein
MKHKTSAKQRTKELNKMTKQAYEREHKRLILAIAQAEDNNDYQTAERLTRELIELEIAFYGE